MGLPPTSRNPAFRITRISHVVLSVTNLERSLDFYTNLIGLVVTETDDDVAYLRGVEESAHHSVVLRRSEHAHAERLGFRVATEDDLDAARVHFEQRGLTAHWADAPHQGRTLHATDIGGVAIELCVTMPTRPRRTLDFADFRGAAATRIDHAQVHVTDPGTYAAFYTELGFRISEYATASGTPSDPLMGVFLARKGDMLDLVALVNRGPRLHHVAFTVHDASVTLPAVCDRAASLGLRDQIAYGPAATASPRSNFSIFWIPIDIGWSWSAMPISCLTRRLSRWAGHWTIPGASPNGDRPRRPRGGSRPARSEASSSVRRRVLIEIESRAGLLALCPDPDILVNDNAEPTPGPLTRPPGPRRTRGSRRCTAMAGSRPGI
jgi:catechol 2,3-dioxygenase